MSNSRDLGLGRKLSVDDRDRAYPMRAVIRVEPKRDWRYWYIRGAWLDQGATGTCVGHAWAHYYEDGPVTHGGPIIDAFEIYREATMLDVWPQNDNGDLQFGTSVRAGAQVLQNRGIISEYRWAWDIQSVVDAILTTGPVVVGTNWYTGMFDVDSKGFLDVEGSVVGGHAYILNGVNTNREILKVKNSWGRNWGWGKAGRKGYAYITISDMERLISEDGEACLAVESRH